MRVKEGLLSKDGIIKGVVVTAVGGAGTAGLIALATYLGSTPPLSWRGSRQWADFGRLTLRYLAGGFGCGQQSRLSPSP